MSHLSISQEFVSTLHRYAPWHYSPSAVGMDNDASITYLHQESQIGLGTNYINNFLSAEYPIVTKKGRRYGGVGITFLEKDAGDTDLLKTNAIGLSLAYNLQIHKNQYISFGLNGNYFSTRTTLENLTTESQWIADEFRYDPSQGLGETIDETNIQYLSLNSGATWYMLDQDLEQKAFFGVSSFRMNRPSESFFEEQRKLPMGFLINAGASLHQNRKVQIFPQVMYQMESGINTINAIVSTKLFIRNDNPYDIINNGSLEILTRYDFNQDASIGLIFNQPNLSLGFSYNFPTSNNVDSRYLNGGSEFGITLSKRVFKAKTKTIVINNDTPGRARDFYFDQPQDQNQTSVTKSKSDVEIIEENIQELDEVKSLQFNLDKNFKFEFGKADLNEPSKAYLDDLHQMMESNPLMILKVVGHTDNIGSNQANYKLSIERAQIVADYLFNKGIDKSRIEVSGKGDTEPIANNETEENRSLNRRVEFIIIINR